MKPTICHRTNAFTKVATLIALAIPEPKRRSSFSTDPPIRAPDAMPANSPTQAKKLK
jgi:hypothetical protein